MTTNEPDTSGVELAPMDLRPTRKKHIHKGPLNVARILVSWFTKRPSQREPPAPHKTQHVRLISISVSHYCEKARWALDLLENDESSPVYYTEDGHPPAFVAFETVVASQDTASATPMAIYVDTAGDTQLKYKSDVLLQEFCPNLYPKAIAREVSELEHDLGDRLGPALRCFCYHHLLTDEHYDNAAEAMTVYSSWIETVLCQNMLQRGLAQGIRKALVVTEETAARSEQELRAVFSELSERLEHSQHLMDTPTVQYGFTAADLTLAALAYPILQPPEMSHFVLEESKTPQPILKLRTELRDTRAGQHVLQMYAKHRPVGKLGKVEMKTLNRDRCVPWKELLLVGTVVAGVAISWFSSKQRP